MQDFIECFAKVNKDAVPCGLVLRPSLARKQKVENTEPFPAEHVLLRAQKGAAFYVTVQSSGKRTSHCFSDDAQ